VPREARHEGIADANGCGWGETNHGSTRNLSPMQGRIAGRRPRRALPECLFRQSIEAPGAGLITAGDTGPYEPGFAPPARRMTNAKFFPDSIWPCMEYPLRRI